MVRCPVPKYRYLLLVPFPILHWYTQTHKTGYCVLLLLTTDTGIGLPLCPLLHCSLCTIVPENETLDSLPKHYVLYERWRDRLLENSLYDPANNCVVWPKTIQRFMFDRGVENGSSDLMPTLVLGV